MSQVNETRLLVGITFGTFISLTLLSYWFIMRIHLDVSSNLKQQIHFVLRRPLHSFPLGNHPLCHSLDVLLLVT